MKSLMVISLMLQSLFFFAQDIPVASPEQFQRFKNSTTYMVKYDDPFSSFNTYMAEDLAKVWTITPFKIITGEEFEEKGKDKDASFIFLSEAMRLDGGMSFTLNLLNIVLGTKSGDMDNMPDLGSAPLSYVWEDDDNEDQYLYKLAGILRFFQYYITYNISNPGSDVKAVVKANKSKLEGKELWLIQSDMADEVNTLEKIKKYYDGTVKFVTVEEIRAAVHAGNSNVVFLHKVGPGTHTGHYCMKFLVCAADGCPVYYEMTPVSDNKPDAFLESDFKAIN